MPIVKPEISGRTIVFLGSFNPHIFQPAWFASQNLLKKDEVEAANIEFINRELVVFSTDWVRVEILSERVTFGTTQTQAFEWLRDLALGTFRVLRHTPIDKLGLNLDIHFKMDSDDKWHAIGHRLAPKEVWKDILIEPGMAGLTIKGSRPDKLNGAIHVRVEPSTKVKPGVFISVNDHFEILPPDASRGAEPILDVLDSSWGGSLERSMHIAETIAGLS